MTDSTETFRVSVISPVYNASEHLRRCVEAAAAEPEVFEVLLVEDDSPDDSLALCHELAREIPKVSVHRHPDGKNHGAGETRNLGVRMASCPYLAFADADNYYLPGRFRVDKQILEEDPHVDGVYGAEGVHFYDAPSREAFYAAGLGAQEFLSIRPRIEPEELLLAIIGRHPEASGALGIDGITLRREAFDRTGGFRPELKLQQDVDFFIRLATCCRMAAGSIDDPVCIRGVHGKQRSTDSDLMTRYRRMRWDLVHEWAMTQDLPAWSHKLFSESYDYYRITNTQRFAGLLYLLGTLVKDPGRIRERMGFFDHLLFHLFGRNGLTLHATSWKNRTFGRAQTDYLRSAFEEPTAKSLASGD